MASRYPTTPHVDYCFNPLTILRDDGRIDVVPCGKCDGCRLEKANSWKQRLSAEIEHSPFSLFFTLTYKNEYLPLLEYKIQNNFGHYEELDTLRWNGKKYVVRNYGTVVDSPLCNVPITNFNYGSRDSSLIVPFAPKKDIQNFLKILRHKIYERFKSSYNIRYYIISEYGETLFRPHMHCILFTRDAKVAQFCKDSALFESWQMCDKALFDKHCTYCNAGPSSYLTQYVTCFSNLPKVYKEDGAKPFRLASKSPAIGYIEHDKASVFEKVGIGDIEFNRQIPRADKSYTFRFSKDYLSSIFPKCYEYGKRDFYELCRTYGLIYDFCETKGYPYKDCSRRLSKILHVGDFNAARTCYKFCKEFGIIPQEYVRLVDLAWYKRSMFALKMQYEYQENKTSFELRDLFYYSNFSDLFTYCRTNRNCVQYFTLKMFLYGFGFDAKTLLNNPLKDILQYPTKDFERYRLEVENILSDMVKLPKFYEKSGISPVNQY